MKKASAFVFGLKINYINDILNKAQRNCILTLLLLLVNSLLLFYSINSIILKRLVVLNFDSTYCRRSGFETEKLKKEELRDSSIPK